MALVTLVIGSESDKKIVEESGFFEVLDYCGVSYTSAVISAHRHDVQLEKFCNKVLNEGIIYFVAAAGMAAHLPARIAVIINYSVPVIGVGLASPEYINAEDALMNIIRMPKDCALACTGVNKAGLKNAAMFICQSIGRISGDERGKILLKQLYKYREEKGARSEIPWKESKIDIKEDTDGSS